MCIKFTIYVALNEFIVIIIIIKIMKKLCDRIQRASTVRSRPF